MRECVKTAQPIGGLVIEHPMLIRTQLIYFETCNGFQSNTLVPLTDELILKVPTFGQRRKGGEQNRRPSMGVKVASRIDVSQ